MALCGTKQVLASHKCKLNLWLDEFNSLICINGISLHVHAGEKEELLWASVSLQLFEVYLYLFFCTHSTRPLQKKILLHCIFNKDVAMIFFFCNKDFHLHVKWEKGGRELCKISMKKKNLRKNTSQHVSKHKIKCFYFPSYKACQEQVYVMLQLKYSELACAGIWGVNQSPT